MFSGLRRRFRRPQIEMTALLADEPALFGPERASYQGGSGPYPKLSGVGLLALTERRLLFRIKVGKSVEVLLEDIVETENRKTFRRQRVGGQRFLVVTTRHGEVGFLVTDPDAWRAHIPQANPR